MARCGCGGSGSGGACACSLVNGNGTTISGDGRQTSPYKVDVKPDPVTGNLVTVGPDGVLVSCEAVQDCVGGMAGCGLEYDDGGNQLGAKISPAAGNTIMCGPDGLYSAAGAVALGCGLQTDEFGAIEVHGVDFSTLTRRSCTDAVDGGSDVALDPACADEGQPVYCGTDGVVRTKPEKFTEVSSSSLAEGITPALTRASLPYRSNPVQITVTNPSDCYCMCGYVDFSFTVGISAAPGAVINVFHEFDLGSGSFSGVTGFVFDQRGAAGSSGRIERPSVRAPMCLDPGETKVVRYRVAVETFTGDNGGAAVSMTSVARDLRYVGTNI